MGFGVLGPVEVWDGGEPCGLGAGRERFVLAVLLLSAGRPITSARLVDALWDAPPPSAKAQLHNISRLRRSVEQDDLIVTNPTGYELWLGDKDTLDLVEFRGLVADGVRAGDPVTTVELLDRALDLWRGPALADIPDEPAAAARRGMHDERLAAEESRVAARLTLGRYDDVLGTLAGLLADHPYRHPAHPGRRARLAAGPAAQRPVRGARAGRPLRRPARCGRGGARGGAQARGPGR